MKKNNSVKEIYDKIKNARKVLMQLHEGPDGDGLASCIAMKYYLERDFNITVKIISPDEISENLKPFSFIKEVEFGKSFNDFNLARFDIFIFLDSGDISYFRNLKVSFPKNSMINIDHHKTNTYFGDLNYIDDKCSSACSVLLKMFKELNVNFDSELSTRLLLGIYTDSIGFSLSEDALKDAVFLVNKGARYMEIVNILKFIPINLLKYFALIVDKFRIENFHGYKIGISSISKKELDKLRLNLSDIRGGPNYLQQIGEVDFLFTLAEMEDYIKGSFRSTKNINISLFAEKLNGGGHKFAAAFRLSKMSLEEAEEKVFNIIKKVGVHKIK